MKRIFYGGAAFVLTAAAITYALLYYGTETASHGNFMRSHDKLWLVSGDKHLFDVTERAFDLIGLFGFAEGIGKWTPVGGPKSPFYPVVVPGSAAVGIAGDEYVIGVASAGGATAYPLRIASFHQTINDDTQEDVVIVYFGNHSHTAAAFSGGAKRNATHLGSTGCLYKNIDLLFDHETESLFMPLAGIFVSGDRLGERLTVLPSAVMTLSEWTKLYPQTRVMTLNTGLKSVRYPRKDILAEGPEFKVHLKSEMHPAYSDDAAVIATSDGWLTTCVAFAGAERADTREVGFDAGGKPYVAHFTPNYKSAWLTDASGHLAPSIRTTYRPYISIMREATVAQVK